MLRQAIYFAEACNVNTLIISSRGNMRDFGMDDFNLRVPRCGYVLEMVQLECIL